jgi:hypothetical protein
VKAKPTGKAPDPYWSLWGRLKSRHGKDEAVREEVNDLPDVGSRFYDEMAAEIQEDHEHDRRVPRLPRRKVELDYDGRNLRILLPGLEEVAKPVHSDTHAVNTLRKLDTDDAYYARTVRA